MNHEKQSVINNIDSLAKIELLKRFEDHTVFLRDVLNMQSKPDEETAGSGIVVRTMAAIDALGYVSFGFGSIADMEACLAAIKSYIDVAYAYINEQPTPERITQIKLTTPKWNELSTMARKAYIKNNKLVKAVLNDWFISNFDSTNLDSPIGQMVFFSTNRQTGNCHTSAIVDYNKTDGTVHTKNGSVYKLGKPHLNYKLMSNTEALAKLGF